MSSYEALTTGVSKASSTKKAKYLALLALLGVSSLAYIACHAFSAQTTAAHQASNGAMSLASFYPPLANPGQVNLFDLDGFGGHRITLNVGFKGNMDQYGFNDQMSSLQIGEGVRVKFCKHANCDGNIWTDSFELLGPYNAPSFYNYKESASNWMSYAEVHRYDPTVEPRVLLLGAGNFDFERSGTFPEGRYSTEDIKTNHIDKPGHSGGASGIVIPSQLKVLLYKGDWFQGAAQELVGPLTADFLGTSGAHLSQWNDQIGSMIVLRRDTPIKVTGTWRKIIASNDLISQSITSAAQIDQTKASESEISASMTSGMEFGSDLVGYKVSVSATAGAAIRSSVSDTLTRSSSIQLTATCTNPNRVKTTLWQWQMTGVRDGAVIMDLSDNEFLCKTGDSPPLCPVGFCDNSECTSCKPF